jgi:hypothetical protein
VVESIDRTGISVEVLDGVKESTGVREVADVLEGVGVGVGVGLCGDGAGAGAGAGAGVGCGFGGDGEGEAGVGLPLAATERTEIFDSIATDCTDKRDWKMLAIGRWGTRRRCYGEHCAPKKRAWGHERRSVGRFPGK